MTVVATSAPVTDAVVTAVGTILGADRVGDGIKPTAGGWQGNPGESEFRVYAVVYGGGIAAVDGSALHPKESAVHVVQVTYWAMTREGAELARDRCRPVVLDHDLPIVGAAVTWTSLEVTRPTIRDDGTQPPLFQAVDLLHLHATPI